MQLQIGSEIALDLQATRANRYSAGAQERIVGPCWRSTNWNLAPAA